MLELGASSVPPRVTLGSAPVLVVGDAGAWFAVVGIELNASPGTGHIVVHRAGTAEQRLPFVIAPVQYAEQRLTVPP
ncbi:MAG: M23 family peptidase, partial [Gammaproteobacteria bacterium]